MSVSVVSGRSRASAAGRRTGLSGLTARLRAWGELSRQRRALARLDRARLRDLGLDEGAAAAEAARPFWDAPTGWR